MNKLFRILESLGRIFKKPTQAGRRISMSPFFRNILSEDDEENFDRLKRFYHPIYYYTRAQQYQQLQKERMKRDTNCGLEELAIKEYQDKSFQLITTGDYGLHENFLHSLQLNRVGADTQYFSFDDIESISSQFESDTFHFDLEDSLMIQR